jgi:hypothetical protein
MPDQFETMTMPRPSTYRGTADNVVLLIFRKGIARNHILPCFYRGGEVECNVPGLPVEILANGRVYFI